MGSESQIMMTGLVNAGMYFVVTSLVVLVAAFLFELLTKYKAWDEIRKGNLAVSATLGGIVLGVANIMRFAITSNSSIADTLIWGGIGTVALLLVYFGFEWLTPKLSVNDEIAKGNTAVGVLSMAFSLAFSFIIGACIA